MLIITAAGSLFFSRRIGSPVFLSLLSTAPKLCLSFKALVFCMTQNMTHDYTYVKSVDLRVRGPERFRGFGGDIRYLLLNHLYCSVRPAVGNRLIHGRLIRKINSGLFDITVCLL